MTPDTDSQTDSPTKSTRWTAIFAFVNRLGRFMLCIVIVWAIAFIITTFQEIRRADRTAKVDGDNVDLDDVTAPPTIEVPELLAGDWQFKGFSWTVSTGQVPSSEIEAWLSALPNSVAAIKQPSFENELVISIMERLGAKTARVGDLQIYQLHLDSTQAIAFANAESPRNIGLVRFAHLSQLGSWTVVTAKPKQSQPLSSRERRDERLLPFPSKHQRYGVRVDEKGMVVAEMIECDAVTAKVREVWESAGWSVQQLPSPSDTATVGHFLCRKDSLSIIAWDVGQASEQGAMWLVVRSPNISTNQQSDKTP